jgi:hypothetical protein
MVIFVWPANVKMPKTSNTTGIITYMIKISQNSFDEVPLTNC